MSAVEAVRWATIAQVAELLQVQPQTVRAMISRGELDARRFGPRLIRVDLSTLGERGRPVGMGR